MPAQQLNVEYFFRLIYNCFHGGCSGGQADLTALSSFAAQLWLWIIIVGYALSVLGLLVIVYATMRLFDLRKREEEYYSTIIASPESIGSMHPRWEHIQSLADGNSQSELREAIIEADIMLDDVLAKEGYIGDGVGEKLKGADKSKFATLQDAWEAHKVRNQIAHEGSSFDLSDTLALRTIAHYEAVFREFKII